MSSKGLKITGALLALIFSIAISLSNANFKVLGFADAAEFALLSDLAGIAHAPGFPAYILLSKLFSMLLSLSGIEHIATLVIFSAVCMGFASLLLYHSALLLLKHSFNELGELQKVMIAACTAIVPLTGTTLWHWSHSVEVYSLQVLLMSMVFYGLCLREDGKRNQGLQWAAIGFGLGLANHHLTMLMFAPFLLLLWPEGWLVKKIVSKKKPVSSKVNWKELIGKEAKHFGIIVGAVLLLFYGWMYFRAGSVLPYAFGSPDTLDRLLYHLSGGAWIKNTQAAVKGIVGMRLPYFLRISFEQFFLCIVFLVLGVIYLIASKRHRLWVAMVFYFIFLFIYQLRIDQTADTDAYLCTPFFLLSTLLPFGMARLCTWYKHIYFALPLFVLAQFFVHFDKTDLRDFDLSTALLRDLDQSAQKGSVVLIADWTNIINYNYARIHDGFREDLCVLNYDLKFTHHDLFRRNYPEIYKEISVSYDRYITLLGQYHPEEIYNTGCTLDQPDLIASYLDLIRSLQNYCKNKNVPFIADPKAYVFLSQQGVFPVAHISGSYVSDRPGIGNDEFLKLEHQWLNNKHVKMDPSASDKLVDLEAALDFQRRYWQQLNDLPRAEKAEGKYREIKRMQNQMKKKMKFLFRPA
ncbi:MAG: DUF2723 domain-containing protein [Bacteroidetes bacterium]|nr:DUF2723 domain-containing protein [Bacteroidota bacterium]